jgi:predicted aconitase with swiveling domain
MKARPLHDGAAAGTVLRLDQPLSFWGGFDPQTGRIIDIHHPQNRESLAGRILAMRESRGSGSAPGGLAEAIRLGKAPAAILLERPDINLAIGAAVAQRLYQKCCPILTLAPDEFARLATGQWLEISPGGQIS